MVTSVPLCDHGVQHLGDVLDRYQRVLNGKQHCNLEPMAELQKKQAFMLGAYIENKLVGIGAVKIADRYGEIKRLIVEKKFRGSGAAAEIIKGLELYTKQQNRKLVNLQTGRLQFAAIRFYEKNGYSEIEPFGQYEFHPMHIFFQKNVCLEQ